MTVREFFLLALSNGAYKRRSWVLSLFSVFKPGNNKDNYPAYLVQRDDQGFFFKNPDTFETVRLEVDPSPKPLISPLDPLTLHPGDLPNVKEKVQTTYGNALVNMIVLVDPFGDRFDFISGKVNIKKVEGVLVDLAKKQEITTDQYLRFTNNVASLAGFTQVSVPAASAQSLTGHPDRFKLRDELLEKYKDRLDDPAVVATIDAELEKMDREWIANSPSAGFYIKDKSFAIVRKRLHYMLGAEQSKGSNRLNLVASALEEGIDPEDLPAMLTTQRLGSYNRGANTALGGESVKFYLRAFQNTSIEEEDCGSTLTMPYPVTEKNWKGFVGFYTLNTQKKRVLVDEARAKAAVGTTLTIRSPLYCKTKGTGLCFTCMGEVNRSNPRALGELAAAVGSDFLNAFMGAVHGIALKLVDYDIKSSLR